MIIHKIIKPTLIWLPSIMMSMIFIQNGLGKIFQINQPEKIIENEAILIVVGIILIFATILFLINKTILWGTSLLALYMTCISIIHILKEKPFEVVAMIVLGTIFSAFLRKPKIFHQTRIEE
ncbi:hypothetical protein [uncultured Christiangramia sp.]|uniref:hypothetical protein n=1 Tax=Christiangramia sp. 3-2217-3z TaxID=3417564 RepID=UPI0026256E30|nr:hypothetical protein [uncultured Christiangramia sp.]